MTVAFCIILIVMMECVALYDLLRLYDKHARLQKGCGIAELIRRKNAGLPNGFDTLRTDDFSVFENIRQVVDLIVCAPFLIIVCLISISIREFLPKEKSA